MLEAAEHKFVVVTTRVQVVTMDAVDKGAAQSILQGWADDDPSHLGTEVSVYNTVLPIED